MDQVDKRGTDINFMFAAAAKDREVESAISGLQLQYNDLLEKHQSGQRKIERLMVRGKADIVSLIRF